jgi:hypothetical protein
MRAKTKKKTKGNKNSSGTLMTIVLFYPLMLELKSVTRYFVLLRFILTKRLSSSIDHHQEHWHINWVARNLKTWANCCQQISSILLSTWEVVLYTRHVWQNHPNYTSPCVPIIVLKTSDCCTRKPDNPVVCRVSSGTPNHPHFTIHIGSTMELPQHYNIDAKISYIGVAEDLQHRVAKHV